MEKVREYVMLAMYQVVGFMHDEDGDTNFISVLMLLGIALALAVVFFGFRKQIVDWVSDNLEQFFRFFIKTIFYL